MKKEEIATLIIIGIILIIDLITLCYTKKCIAKISDDLKNLENMTVESIKAENNDNSGNAQYVGTDYNNSDTSGSNSEGEENKKVDSKELMEQSEDIYNEWLGMNDTLTFYIEHDELEKVNVQLERIIANFNVDSKEDAMPEIKEAIYILRHIEKKQRLTLRNIL